MSPLPQKTLTTRYVSLSLSLLLFLTFSDDTFSTPPSALFPEQVHHAVVPAQQHVPHVLQAGRARVRELPAAHGGGHETLHQNVSSRHPRTPLKRFPRLTSLHFISFLSPPPRSSRTDAESASSASAATGVNATARRLQHSAHSGARPSYRVAGLATGPPRRSYEGTQSQHDATPSTPAGRRSSTSGLSALKANFRKIFRTRSSSQ